jgi:hypothetical protein
MARRHAKAILAIALCLTAGAAEAVDIDRKLRECRLRAPTILGTDLEAVKVKDEGQCTDNTHAVNRSVRARGQTETFQGSFERDGCTWQQFVVNFPAC